MKNIILLALSLIMGISLDANSQALSDAQIKMNITPLTKSLDIVTQLSPKTYEFDHMGYKHLNLAKGKKIGFIAEEFSRVLPQLVNERQVSYAYGKNMNRSVSLPAIDEISLIPLLVGAIKEQQTEIIRLRTEIAEIKKSILTK